MTFADISRAVLCNRNINVRAAWVTGGDADGIISIIREPILLHLFEGGDGWLFGAYQTEFGRLPFFGSTLPKLLNSFLTVPPSGINLPLLTCYFGSLIVDRDGGGKTLKYKASDTWRVGPPPIGRNALPRLRWEMQRVIFAAGRESRELSIDLDRPDLQMALSLSLERTIVVHCRLRCLWPIPLSDLERVEGDVRYEWASTILREFLDAENTRRRRAVVVRAAGAVLDEIL